MKAIILIFLSVLFQPLFCQVPHIIINPVDGSDRISINNNSSLQYNIGTKWTYETTDYDQIGWPKSYLTYEIIDTTIWNGQKAFVIENSLGGPNDYMWVDVSKVTIWDDRIQDYLLTYDFNETDQFHVVYKPDFSQPHFDTATFIVDSILNYTIDNVDIQAQHFHFAEGGMIGDRGISSGLVYNGIGFEYLGLKSELGFFSTGDFVIDRLRCFEGDSLNINFVGYPCDSTWNTTSIHTLESRNIVLHPNPTSGQIYFDGLDQEYRFEVFDMSGKKLINGITEHYSILLSGKGMFYVRLFVNDRWLGQTVVVE